MSSTIYSICRYTSMSTHPQEFAKNYKFKQSSVKYDEPTSSLSSLPSTPQLTPEDLYDVQRRFKYLHLLLNLGSKGTVKIMTKMNLVVATGD